MYVRWEDAFQWGLTTKTAVIGAILAQLDAVIGERETNPALSTDVGHLSEMLISCRRMTREEMIFLGARKWAKVNRPEAVPGLVPKPPPIQFQGLVEGVPAPELVKAKPAAKSGYSPDGAPKPAPPQPYSPQARGAAVKGGYV